MFLFLLYVLNGGDGKLFKSLQFGRCDVLFGGCCCVLLLLLLFIIFIPLLYLLSLLLLLLYIFVDGDVGFGLPKRVVCLKYCLTFRSVVICMIKWCNLCRFCILEYRKCTK